MLPFLLSRLLRLVSELENDFINLKDEFMYFLNYFKKTYSSFIDQNNVFKKALFPKATWNFFVSYLIEYPEPLIMPNPGIKI
jgi:hypothetical protein